jgi:pantetheine-phosphate adenylyltransferase
MMTIAVYAGSFDPITAGHLSVIARAARLFERLIVVVAVHPTKRATFTVEERVEMIAESTRTLANVSCASTSGLVVEHARAVGATVLIRGVRGATDSDYETALAHANHALAPEIETVFLPAAPSLAEVSSSRLKELARQGEPIHQYCPASVAARLRARLLEEHDHV